MAFGALNLITGDFWSLTPAEFNDLLTGYQWRREQEDNRLIQHAWSVANFDRAKRLKFGLASVTDRYLSQKHLANRRNRTVTAVV